MSKKLIGVLVDVEQETAKRVEISDNLDTFYELLNCDTIDIVARRIGGKPFEIICDDEGLWKEQPKVSAIDNLGQPQLVGNLLIAGSPDEEGDLTSLTEEEVAHVLSKVQHLYTNFFPEGYPMLTQVEY